jgi:hypothetical protein
MRSFVVAPVLAAAAFGVAGQRYALDEFDLPVLAPAPGAAGTVEAVRETPVIRDRHAFDADLFEHRFHQDSIEELVIRLDSGRVVTVARDPTLRLQPGQRVRVMLPEGGMQ